MKCCSKFLFIVENNDIERHAENKAARGRQLSFLECTNWDAILMIILRAILHCALNSGYTVLVFVASSKGIYVRNVLKKIIVKWMIFIYLLNRRLTTCNVTYDLCRILTGLSNK